jgi:hypothetical protein
MKKLHELKIRLSTYHNPLKYLSHHLNKFFVVVVVKIYIFVFGFLWIE